MQNSTVLKTLDEFRNEDSPSNFILVTFTLHNMLAETCWGCGNMPDVMSSRETAPDFWTNWRPVRQSQDPPFHPHPNLSEVQGSVSKQAVGCFCVCRGKMWGYQFVLPNCVVFLEQQHLPVGLQEAKLRTKVSFSQLCVWWATSFITFVVVLLLSSWLFELWLAYLKILLHF